MIEYHKTDGPRGEIWVEWEGQFVGFIVSLGRAHQWGAYTQAVR